jgi:hypothetical protein
MSIGHQFKVILTNIKLSARKLLALHNGRGAQVSMTNISDGHLALGDQVR